MHMHEKGCANIGIHLTFWACSEKMHEWIWIFVLCVRVVCHRLHRMSAPVQPFVWARMSQVRYIQMYNYWCFWMRVERHTLFGAWDGCVGPGTAPHAQMIATLDPISLAMELLISHIVVADGSAGKRICKLNLYRYCHFCRHASARFMCASVCSPAHVFIYLSSQWKELHHVRFFCHRGNCP